MFVNKCAHRGATVCRTRYGNASDFPCIYHQWRYDLSGKLVAVPFRRGVMEGDQRVGGMPEDFRIADHCMKNLKVEAVNGVIFASFDHGMVPVRQYPGA